ncbi:MAG: cysteine--tRNA ligase [Candidatus Aenigmarchaeota archaeon]|nr:cysteine--tRNA ligase [Candidatus Aenigmarchaeota archaeon]
MIKITNTATGKKEDFKPREEGHVYMYVCGPTVYGPMHIGNVRTFVTFDVIYRYFKWKGFDVKYVQNITDVGHLTDVGQDKIINGAKKMGMGVFEFVDLMTKNYFEDLKLLNIEKPDVSPRASEHVPDMIGVIKKLIEKGYAYESNGYVYYDISKFDNYGKLSRQNPEYLEKQRKDSHGDKKHEGDFVLWFPAPDDYPMKWDSPWGKGFPGWHIECSTMSSKYLGFPLDIHGGGKDLIFPHHEDEIAQAEGASGKKFCNHWIHTEFILINNEKMSKSLGNVITARDAAKKYGKNALRYFLISSNYRNEINLTEESIECAKKTVERLIDFVDKMKELKVNSEYNQQIKEGVERAKNKFEESMDDDFNTPMALAAVFDLMNDVNKAIDENKVSKENLTEVYDFMIDIDRVLGVLQHEKEELPRDILELIVKRETLRKLANFDAADEIRKQLTDKGYGVEDGPNGPRWKKVK